MLLEDLIYLLQKEYNEKGNITVGVYNEEVNGKEENIYIDCPYFNSIIYDVGKI